MKTICETDALILEHEYETVWLKCKSSGNVLLADRFYGEPQCGLINEHGRWAVVAGEHLTIWTPGESKVITRDDLQWVHDVRCISDDRIEILIDPWGDAAAVWELDIATFELVRIKSFTDYRTREYSDHVDW